MHLRPVYIHEPPTLKVQKRPVNNKPENCDSRQSPSHHPHLTSRVDLFQPAFWRKREDSGMGCRVTVFFAASAPARGVLPSSRSVKRLASFAASAPVTFFVPVPDGMNVVHYRYKFDFKYNAVGEPPQNDSAISPEYTLRILEP